MSVHQVDFLLPTIKTICHSGKKTTLNRFRIYCLYRLSTEETECLTVVHSTGEYKEKRLYERAP